MAVDTAAVLASIRVLAPEFASADDADINALSSILGGAVSADAFGARTTEAVARIVAHEMTLQARAAASSAGAAGVGAINSLRAGDLSITFGGMTATSGSHEDEHYRQTHHGLAYLQIRDSRAGVGFGVLV